MEDIFIILFNMSITASYLSIAIIIIKFVFRKMPKWISCALWSLVGLRLIIPFSFESVLSLIPDSEPIPSDIMISSQPHISTGIPSLNSTINPIISETFSPDPSNSANPMQIIIFIMSLLWIAGFTGMLIYATISYIAIKRKTVISIKTEEGVYICDNIDSPFILGVIKPLIYIPSYIDDTNHSLILAHERAHIKRKDHIWKPLAFIILSVYWFNPVMWTVFILMCRDIEAACDEKVIREMDTEKRKQYSEALINCSAPKKYISACPLAFGETGVKKRIKNVLNYKKPTFWIIAAALIISIMLSVCFMTNPKSARIADIENYENIYKDVHKVQLYIGAGYISTYEDASEIIKEIKKVRIEKNAIDESRDENRDKSFRIEFNDNLSINTNESFTYLWLDDSVKPSFSYKIKNPEILKDLFSISNHVTGVEDVYITIDKVITEENSSTFEVTWHNERNDTIHFGEFFHIEKFTENGIWEKITFPENYVFLTIGYILSGNSEKTEDYFCPVELKDGLYRFSSSFSFKNESYFARATFTVGDTISDVGGADCPASILKGKQLTLGELTEISKKGKELSWEDFDEFSYVETGSGLYIRHYQIDGRFSLAIGGGGTDTKPMYMYLAAPSEGEGKFIDIRGDDVEAFIEDNKNNPIPEPDISFTVRSFPVDKSGNNLGAFIKFGADNTDKLTYSSIKYLPVIRIKNENELKSFRDFFAGTFDFHIEFEDTQLSLSDFFKKYEGDEEFFNENDFLIMYVSADNEKDRFDAIRVYPDKETLNICIRQGHYETVGNASPSGWLITLAVQKNDLQEITELKAYVGETISLPEPDILNSYVYKPGTDTFNSAALHLYNNNTFMLSPSVYSSYIETGTFEFEGDLLILISSDGISTYVFEINNTDILFKKNESVVHKSFYDIPDKACFTEY